MEKEDYEAHKEDYKDHNISSGCFVLIQDVYIKTLENKLEEALKSKHVGMLLRNEKPTAPINTDGNICREF